MAAVALVLFVCDPLLKVFSDTPVPQTILERIEVWCAGNEYESAQFAIRAEAPLPATTVRVGPLTHESGYILPADGITWSFVGTIPLRKNTPCERDGVLVRQAPCDMPDVLLPDRSRDLPARTTQPVWLSFHVPAAAPAGVYRGEVVVASGDVKSALPIELHVWSFALSEERHLFVTTWIDFAKIAKAHQVREWSNEFWPVYGRYLDNMHEHRQNIAWVPWSLVKAYREMDGRLTFDYTLFDLSLIHI